jgi:hypothetical protein
MVYFQRPISVLKPVYFALNEDLMTQGVVDNPCSYKKTNMIVERPN